MSVSHSRFGPCGGELPVDQVVVDRRAGLAVQPRFLAWTDQIRCWVHSRLTRFAPAVMPRCGELVGDEPVPELGVVVVDVDGGVDQVRVVPVPVA